MSSASIVTILDDMHCFQIVLKQNKININGNDNSLCFVFWNISSHMLVRVDVYYSYKYDSSSIKVAYYICSVSVSVQYHLFTIESVTSSCFCVAPCCRRRRTSRRGSHRHEVVHAYLGTYFQDLSACYICFVYCILQACKWYTSIREYFCIVMMSFCIYVLKFWFVILILYKHFL